MLIDDEFWDFSISFIYWESSQAKGNLIDRRQVDVALAGGMESMSQVPYFLRHARRGGYHYGHGTSVRVKESMMQRGEFWGIG